MGIRFRKSINLGKGFKASLSKSGLGFSWGFKGFRVTKTAKGAIRTTASLPGTGLSYSKEFSLGKKKKKGKAEKEAAENQVNEAVNPEEGAVQEEVQQEMPKWLQSVLTIGGWLLVAAFAMLALTYMPSITSILALLAAALVAPIPKWQEFLSRFISGPIKIIAVVALIVVALILAPSGSAAEDASDPAATPAVTQDATTGTAQDGQTIVYVTKSGSKYHSTETCSSMKDPLTLTLEEAKDKGYEPCSRCH